MVFQKCFFTKIKNKKNVNIEIYSLKCLHLYLFKLSCKESVNWFILYLFVNKVEPNHEYVVSNFNSSPNSNSFLTRFR